MGIKRLLKDIGTNKRKRQLKKGKLEDRVEALESMVEILLTDAKPTTIAKLPAHAAARRERAKQADQAHPHGST